MVDVVVIFKLYFHDLCTVKPVLRGHPWDNEKVAGLLRQVKISTTGQGNCDF